MDLISGLAALLLVLGLVGLLAMALRRLQLAPGNLLGGLSGNREKEIELRETKILDSRNRMAVVRWRGCDYLLAIGERGTTLLDQSANHHNAETTKRTTTAKSDSAAADQFKDLIS